MEIQWRSRRFFPDLYGGLERRGYELVKTWHRMGHSVSVMTEGGDGDPPARMEVLPGLWCARIGDVKVGRLWPVAPWVRVGHWIRGSRQNAAPGGIIVAAYPECVIASKLARPGRPVVYNCVSVSVAKQQCVKGFRPTGQQTALERLAAAVSDHIVVGSANVQRQVCSFLGCSERKVQIVLHGIDVKRFACARPSGMMRELRDRGYFVVLYVGRLDEEKGVDLAIRALARMRRRCEARLVVAGEGPQRAALERLAAKLADVLVLPSRYEAFGTVLIEAMAAGVPCVAWRYRWGRVLVASEEIIEDGQTGFCVAALDIRAMAERLDQLAADPWLRMRLGQAARVRCRERFSLDRMAREYVGVAWRVLKRRDSTFGWREREPLAGRSKTPALKTAAADDGGDGMLARLCSWRQRVLKVRAG